MDEFELIFRYIGYPSLCKIERQRYIFTWRAENSSHPISNLSLMIFTSLITRLCTVDNRYVCVLFTDELVINLGTVSNYWIEFGTIVG